MISEMLTGVPGPISRAMDTERVIFSEKMEKTNVWDLDGNRFLDLTSGGGLLPFGFVDEGVTTFEDLNCDLGEYGGRLFDEANLLGFLSERKVIYIGEGVTSAFRPPVERSSVQLFELADLCEPDADLVIVRAQYLDELSLERVASWCGQWGVEWLVDESDFGMFRCGKALLSSDLEPDYILTSIAGSGMVATNLLFSKNSDLSKELESLKVAKNYADKDLLRTNKLQAMELSGLLKDSMEGRDLGHVGAYHFIELESIEEVKRVCHSLLQRGIIVATMHNRVVLLPSLYLALGEIIFAVNHLRLVIDDVHEASLPWMSDSLRKS